MIQELLSYSIQLISIAATSLFLLQFFHFVNTHSLTVNVQIAPITPSTPQTKTQNTTPSSPLSTSRPHSRSAAKSKKSTAATTTLKSQPTQKTPSSIQLKQISLQHCHTGKANGHIHINVNSLTAPLPANLKVYSVKGRFKGVRLDDLKNAGYNVT